MPRQKKQRLKRRADGRYACRYKDKWFMADSEDEALAAREAYKKQEALEALHKEKHYFGEYGMRWINAYKAHLTAAPYNTHIRMMNRFMSVCGNKPMAEYTQTDISTFYQTFAGKSSSTIHSARDTIKGVFKAAYADGIIQRDPAQAVTPPKGTKGTHRAITDEERKLIMTVEHRLRPAVMTMLYAGLRKGEALALRVERDVDFKGKTITVREAVRFRANGKPEIVDPKTEAGVRTVPLLDVLEQELTGKSGLLCTSADGSLMTQSAWERAWDSYMTALSEKKNGCKKRWAKKPWQQVEIRAHDLRHSYCTMLYDSGVVDLKTAMLWMGHADQTMTMQIYTHLTEQRRTEAENALRKAEKTLIRRQDGRQEEDVPRETIGK